MHSAWSMRGRAEGCNAWEWEGTEHMWSGLNRQEREQIQPLKRVHSPRHNLLRFAETRLNRALAHLMAICHAFNTICFPC